MPTKRSYRKKRGAKRPRRRRRWSPRKSIPLSGFPESKLVKLRYVDSNVTLDAGAGLTATQVYRANSVFDPDYTGVGHQPMGFDQWASVYNRYTVLGAKITVKPATITNTATDTSCIYGITLGGDTAPLSHYTSINNILESKLTRGYKRLVYSLYGNAKPVSKNFSAKKFFGVADVQDGASLSALVTTNPSKMSYFSVWQASLDGNNPQSMSAVVQIDYIVLFRAPKNLDGS